MGIIGGGIEYCTAIMGIIASGPDGKTVPEISGTIVSVKKSVDICLGTPTNVLLPNNPLMAVAAAINLARPQEVANK